MDLRSKNRQISGARIAKSSFLRLENIMPTLTISRLQAAEREFKETRSTTDKDVEFLLRELSAFGYRHPLSNESRMLMRRKIKSLCLKYGMPSIWFTINPNDLNNPVKLRLAAHRKYSRQEAEEMLDKIRQGFGYHHLSISDPVSSAIFFHREIEAFFRHYVRVGDPSVFGKVSKYYATVETNERGALHLHGLMWLHGNLYLPTLLEDACQEGEQEYRRKICQYVDDVFCEVGARYAAKSRSWLTDLVGYR
jgi:hypothetical protein